MLKHFLTAHRCVKKALTIHLLDIKNTEYSAFGMMVSMYFLCIKKKNLLRRITEGFAGIQFPHGGIKFISSQHPIDGQTGEEKKEEKLINKSQKSAL